MKRDVAGENRWFFFQISTLRVVCSGEMGTKRRSGLLWMDSVPSRQNAQPRPSSTRRAVLDRSV